MNSYIDTIQNLNNIIYKPNNLIITNLKEEKQNAEYAGCIFHLNNKTIRFRKSKITPNKIGQFVSFGRKMTICRIERFLMTLLPTY